MKRQIGKAVSIAWTVACAVMAYAYADQVVWVVVFGVLAVLHAAYAVAPWPWKRKPEYDYQYLYDNHSILFVNFDERDAFEAWCKRNPQRFPIGPLKNGVYPDLRTQCAWEGWQR